VEIEFDEVKRLLPQKWPMLMVDRVVELEKGTRAVALKNISGNEIWFLGHFPDRAVLPGALLMEGMAQVAILLFRKSFEGEFASATDPNTAFFFGSTKARFFRPVVPGEQLMIEVTVVKVVSTGGIVDAVARVGGLVVAKAQLGFGVKRREA
jgi:3-hydroxyacyl-[acyl-carrier-protein] dehydratase